MSTITLNESTTKVRNSAYYSNVQNQEPKRVSTIKDLTEIKAMFREAVKPLDGMLEYNQEKLNNKNTPEHRIPYILDDIERLSDVRSDTEAVFGVLLNDYSELGDRCIFLENKWKEASKIVLILKKAVADNLSRDQMGDVILEIQKNATW